MNFTILKSPKRLAIGVGIVIALFFLFRICHTPQIVQSGNQQATKKELWTCSMHPQVIQDHPGSCPICHMTLVPLKTSEADHSDHESAEKDERKIKYWWDPMMSPPYISKSPGKSPMGMDLEPVYEDKSEDGTELSIDPVIVQNMGIRTAAVKKELLSQEVIAVGYLSEAEPNVHDVNLLFSGWIKKLHVNFEGMHVEKGQALFDLYSPEVTVAIQELISSKPTGNNNMNSVFDSARKKLELWGFSKEQIESFLKENTAPSIITFLSPFTGEVILKSVVEGAAFKSGDQVYRIVDLKTLWLTAQVFEKDLSAISMGEKAYAKVSEKNVEGKVIFVDPRIDFETRSTKVRLQLLNPDLSLRPGMFATVTILADTKDPVLSVPTEAVIDTGKRKISFVTLNDGKFALREIETGRAGSGGRIEILSGLSENEEVVTSGQFLLDSESRLREAVQKFLKEKQETLESSSTHEGTDAHNDEGHSND